MQFKEEMGDRLIDLVKQVYEASVLFNQDKYNNILGMTIDHLEYSGTFSINHVKYILTAAHEFGIPAPGLYDFFVGLDEIIAKHRNGDANLVIQRKLPMDYEV